MEVYGAMIERVRERILRGEDVPDCLVKTLINTQEEEKACTFVSIWADRLT